MMGTPTCTSSPLLPHLLLLRPFRRIPLQQQTTLPQEASPRRFRTSPRSSRTSPRRLLQPTAARQWG
ncbi:unnamed protein product [Closterium sp. NIES-53]